MHPKNHGEDVKRHFSKLRTPSFDANKVSEDKMEDEKSLGASAATFCTGLKTDASSPTWRWRCFEMWTNWPASSLSTLCRLSIAPKTSPEASNCCIKVGKPWANLLSSSVTTSSGEGLQKVAKETHFANACSPGLRSRSPATPRKVNENGKNRGDIGGKDLSKKSPQPRIPTKRQSREIRSDLLETLDLSKSNNRRLLTSHKGAKARQPVKKNAFRPLAEIQHKLSRVARSEN